MKYMQSMNLVAAHSRHKLENRENTEKTVSVEMEEADETIRVPCNIGQEQISPRRQSSLPICSEEELDDAAIAIQTIPTQTLARPSSAPLPDREVALKKNCERSLKRMSMGSNIVTEEKSLLHESNHLYRFSSKDVEVGPVLGQGAFAYVRQGSIRNIDTRSSCSSRNFGSNCKESTNCAGDPVDEVDNGTPTELNPGNYYAVKKLRQDLSDSRRVHGAIDLAREAQFLMALSHPNIVGFNGLGDEPGTSGFFILIEKLNKTLTSEILLWKAQSAYVNKNAMNLKIVGYAHKIASALAYLHSKNMIYRDTKPDNIGFNAQGEIKLFDLGLAKELLEDRKVKENEYIISIAGTGRYMSPEVLSGKLYGLPADTFSFSLLLWQMLHQETPFMNFNARQHRRGLLMWKTRPKISKKIPSAVKDILKKGWEHKPKKRLRMKEIERRLHDYLHE